MSGGRVRKVGATGALGAAALVVVSLVVAGCGVFSSTNGTARDGWVWPAAAPLPAGATAVALDVASIPADVRPGVEYAACPAALLLPVSVTFVAGDAVQPIHYRGVDTGPEVRVRWPVGFTARRAPDLQIVAPDGVVIAAAGRPAEGLGGGMLGNDDTFTVCMPEYTPHMIEPGAT